MSHMFLLCIYKKIDVVDCVSIIVYSINNIANVILYAYIILSYSMKLTCKMINRYFDSNMWKCEQ